MILCKAEVELLNTFICMYMSNVWPKAVFIGRVWTCLRCLDETDCVCWIAEHIGHLSLHAWERSFHSQFAQSQSENRAARSSLDLLKWNWIW